MEHTVPPSHYFPDREVGFHYRLFSQGAARENRGVSVVRSSVAGCDTGGGSPRLSINRFTSLCV